MRSSPITALVVVALASPAARAEPTQMVLARSCADVAADGLDEATRTRTQETLGRTLEEANLFVVDRECTETYRVVVLHDMIELTGPHTTIREVRSLDFGSQLAEMVGRERIVPDPPPEDSPASDTDAEPGPDVAIQEPADDTEADELGPSEPDPSEPLTEERPVKNLFYGRFGFGAVGSIGADAMFAVGVRHSMTTADVDVSLGGSSAITFGKVELLSRPKPFHPAPYGGGGLSLSSVHTTERLYDGTYDHSGGGVAAELSGGIVLTPSHKWFLQADVSLPFYEVADIYPIVFSMSLGYGIVGH